MVHPHRCYRDDEPPARRSAHHEQVLRPRLLLPPPRLLLLQLPRRRCRVEVSVTMTHRAVPLDAQRGARQARQQLQHAALVVERHPPHWPCAQRHRVGLASHRRRRQYDECSGAMRQVPPQQPVASPAATRAPSVLAPSNDRASERGRGRLIAGVCAACGCGVLLFDRIDEIVRLWRLVVAAAPPDGLEPAVGVMTSTVVACLQGLRTEAAALHHGDSEPVVRHVFLGFVSSIDVYDAALGQCVALLAVLDAVGCHYATWTSIALPLFSVCYNTTLRGDVVATQKAMRRLRRMWDGLQGFQLAVFTGLPAVDDEPVDGSGKPTSRSPYDCKHNALC